MTTVHRVLNFSAGPAVLPVSVLEQIQADLVALPGVGMSILEVSHRSKAFEAILAKAEADIRALAGIPSNYKVLFLQGGASTQFSMVPMNLLGAGMTADYVDTGSWADKAIKEAKKVGAVNVAATTKADNYSRIPEARDLALTPGAAYVHITSNNTIEGTQFHALPDVGDRPLVSDTSSDMLSRPIDVLPSAMVRRSTRSTTSDSGSPRSSRLRGTRTRSRVSGVTVTASTAPRASLSQRKTGIRLAYVLYVVRATRQGRPPVRGSRWNRAWPRCPRATCAAVRR